MNHVRVASSTRIRRADQGDMGTIKVERIDDEKKDEDV